MSTVNTSSSVLSAYSYKDTSSTSSSESSALGRDAFLQLLVTQMKNQNPLDPQDNTEFVSQLAQFSSLESMQNLSDTTDAIYSSYQSVQALQASSLVGRSVIVEAGSTQVDTSSGLSGSLVLPNAGSNVTVGVYDANGSLVKSISLGSLSAGTYSFDWDGTNESGELQSSGTYTFKATAGIGGENTALTTYLPATVSSVTINSSGGELMLNLAGLGSLALSKVQAIAD
ncbi:flagellar biosynthesis protein FlgD [Pseudomonas indoloxydans]|uniref:Basal-body rod modification protein FlgD n=1 Tax=Ectopseudomonas oleovorans TaxID=301 RepID=A0A2T5PIT8_ECTOL|nr:flagellar hook assembly protein FlgD [Pseudomonas indoloxydans]PTU77637.1 flagellar biosynthesis protein FlgD [Pseudomonas indoloxydans]